MIMWKAASHWDEDRADVLLYWLRRLDLNYTKRLSNYQNYQKPWETFQFFMLIQERFSETKVIFLLVVSFDNSAYSNCFFILGTHITSYHHQGEGYLLLHSFWFSLGPRGCLLVWFEGACWAFSSLLLFFIYFTSYVPYLSG